MSSHETEDLSTPDDDYIKRRDEDFKKNFSKNCDALYSEIARTVSAQEKDGYSEKFYIGPVDFNDGNSETWFSGNKFSSVIFEEMKKRNIQAREKYEKGKSFAAKNNKPFTGNQVFDIEKITYVFHAYDTNNVVLFTNNKDVVAFLLSIDLFLNSEKDPNNIEKKNQAVDVFQYYLELVPSEAEFIQCKIDGGSIISVSYDPLGVSHICRFGSEKPMTERDEYHRFCYKYFIFKGVVKIEDEEEMIFGDELL
jgi:hypothetical protein